MTNLPKKSGPENIAYKGRMIEIVEQPMIIGDKKRTFEKARRAPGTRLIIVKDEKVLISREHRTETNSFDYRLPGGKVFDSLSEYTDFLSGDGEILKEAERGAAKECVEEAGIQPNSLKHFLTANAGATIEWDLYFFIVEDFTELDAQSLEDGEVIETSWKSQQEIERIIFDDKMAEYRSVGALCKYFLKIKTPQKNTQKDV